MFLIVGYVIILASALGTYSVHGSLAALWVPLEYIAIVGLTVGGFVAGNDIKIIKATVGALPGIFKGSKFTKALYVDLLAMLFEVLAKVRKEGLRFLPDSVVRMLPGELSKPVAALTNGGPPKKMVPAPLTMMASSLIAGTYAPDGRRQPERH